MLEGSFVACLFVKVYSNLNPVIEHNIYSLIVFFFFNIMATMNKSSHLIALAICMCVVQVAMAELHRIEHYSATNTANGSLRFLVVGDWGRKGEYNQSQVAHQMGIIGEKLDIDFVISTGDNFYEDGLTSVDDPAFEESFTNIYTAPTLQKLWYNVLGNHDYRGDALAQLSSILHQKESRWICLRSYIVNTDVADIFFVDTTPFQDKYFTDPEDHTYDWRDILPRENYLSNLLKELDGALRVSSAKWKIVIGHHTILSAGHHGNTKELQIKLLPILKANNVDFYINGHDHCLEHISDPDSELQFLTSGGGSKAWRGDVSWWNSKELKFYYDGQGFMAMQITQNEVGFQFFDIFGNVLHKWATSKTRFSSI